MKLSVSRTLTLLGVLTVVPVWHAEAQQLIKACWVEGSGVVYRVDTLGAPPTCTRETHKPIEWVLGSAPSVGVPVPLSLLGTTGDATLRLENSGGGQALFATASGSLAAARVARSEGTGPAMTVANLATGDGVGRAFNATGSGTQSTAEFMNNGSGGALSARSNSTAQATVFAANSNTGVGQALFADSKGSNATISAVNSGTVGGNALYASSNSPNGSTIFAVNTSTTGGQTLYVENKAPNTTISAINSGTSGGGSIYAKSSSIYSTAGFYSDNTEGGNAIYGESKGTNATIGLNNLGPTGGALNAFSRSTFTTAYFGNDATGGGNSIFADSKGFGPTITARNSGNVQGAAIQGLSQGNNLTGDFRNTGTGGALYLENVSTAPTVLVNANGGGTAIITKSSNQNGVVFENTGTGQNIAVLGVSKGVWPTAQFENRNGGPALRTVGQATIVGQLSVEGNYSATGTKNAVVPTSSGIREMYTEEATEVWFADYGQATLRDSTVWVPFDATFSETIESDRPYHVFVQAYGEGSLFVSRRTADGFEVKRASNAAPAEAIEFSYRLVAKRRGYSDRRLRPHTPSVSEVSVPMEQRP